MENTKTEPMSAKPDVEPIDLFRGPDELWRLHLRVGSEFWAVIIPPGARADFERAGVRVREGHANKSDRDRALDAWTDRVQKKGFRDVF